MMLVQSATYEGTLAAENAVLGEDRDYRHAIVPHGGFTDPEYASVGLTEVQAREELGDEDCSVAVRTLLRPGPRGDRRPSRWPFASSSCPALRGRVLGAHIVGEQAVEVVQLAVDRHGCRHARRATREPGACLPYLYRDNRASRQATSPDSAWWPASPRWRTTAKARRNGVGT